MPALILPRFLAPGRDDRLSALSQDAPARVPVAGVDLRRHGVNVFECPVCSKSFRHDDEYEPLCTGPNPTADDHPPTVMILAAVSPIASSFHGR